LCRAGLIAGSKSIHHFANGNREAMLTVPEHVFRVCVSGISLDRRKNLLVCILPPTGTSVWMLEPKPIGSLLTYGLPFSGPV
jgi:hypothetical protein